MKTRDEVTADKLRGGFYSTPALVDLCLQRSAQLLGGRTNLRVLEPAAGDGAFVRGLTDSLLSDSIEDFQAIELIPEEAQKCREALDCTSFAGAVRTGNVLEWNLESSDLFDLVLGNPPYVRFQFVSADDRQRAVDIGIELGIPGSAVSNLWIPVFLLSLQRLREGGVFSLILPTEFLTGVSAGRVRRWLIKNTRDLQIDLFEPGSFPAVLQEVMVLTGRRVHPTDRSDPIVRFADHNGGIQSWEHPVSEDSKTWTGYLLPPAQYRAVSDVLAMPGITRMGRVAKFSVSTVTGANSYFCVNSETVDEHDLARWTIPLLPRTRYAPGLRFDVDEHHVLTQGDRPAWLLDFAAGKPSPLDHPKAANYVANGERENLHTRYKTRIRDPWFRVPVVPPGDLLLAKRSNHYPRVLVNAAKVVTTDTIYRGQVLPASGLTADDLAASFHNSLTLLSAEIEGRSFGGGVLELVPSEISSLAIPSVPTAGSALAELDEIARRDESSESLIEATDVNLRRWLPEIDDTHMNHIREARELLVNRRTLRS